MHNGILAGHARTATPPPPIPQGEEQ
jgi:hypothetical protein